MRAFVFVGLMATLVSSACSDDTGILVQTTTRDGFTESIDKLHFFVGAYASDLASDNAEFYVDLDPLPEVIVNGRDLASSPHRLMIRPPADADPEARYAIGVLAYAGGEKVGFGYLEEPVGFVQGSITQWPIEIDEISGNNRTDCIRWISGDTRYGIANGNDLDCDGYAAGPMDCDDSDPTVNGLAERCDNGIDDNCDGVVDAPSTETSGGFVEIADGADNSCDGICDGPEPDGTNILDSDNDGFTEWGRYGVCSMDPGPSDCDTTTDTIHPGAWEFCDNTDSNCDGEINEPTPCFFQEEDMAGGRCLQGTRACEGTNPKDCEPIDAGGDTLTFDTACSNFENCPADSGGSRAKCLLTALAASLGGTATCKTWHSPTTGTCSTGGGELTFPDNTSAAGDLCTYQIIGPATQQGYKVSLQAGSTGVESQLVNACDGVHLHIETTDSSARAVILIAFSLSPEIETIYKVPLGNLVTPDCDALGSEALKCTDWVIASPVGP